MQRKEQVVLEEGDFLIDLMTYTYLFDIPKIKKALNKYWNEYESIIKNKNSTFEDLNKARAILFLVSNYYCEQIAPIAIERRLPCLSKKMTLVDFLEIVDKKQKKKYLKEELFKKLVEYYDLIRDFKNSHIKDNRYHFEKEFLENYNKKRPKEERELKF